MAGDPNEKDRFGIADLCGAAVIGVILAELPLLHNASAYYRDDMQAQYMPTFYAIGTTLLKEHVIPLLTTQTWYGGNLVGEYHYALFNPVELILYCLLPLFKSLSAGAAFLALVHYAIFTAGGFALARSLGISRGYAYVAAIAISTNNFVFYWYASSWFPAFSSMAFMVWAMAFLLRTEHSRGDFVGAVISTALVGTAGWPQALLALALFALIIALCRKTGELFYAAKPLISAGLGFGLAAVAILPVFGMGATASRADGVFNNDFMVPQLSDLLAVSLPTHLAWIFAFGGYEKLEVNLFYGAWFVMPLLFVIDWRQRISKDEQFAPVAIFALILLIAAQGPEHLGPVRWPIRWMPYFHIAAVISVIALAEKFSVAQPIRRLPYAIGGILLMALLSIQKAPEAYWRILFGALVVCAACCVIFAWRRARAMPIFALIATVSLSLISRHGIALDMKKGNWGFEELGRPISTADLISVPPTYSLVLTGTGYRSDALRLNDFWFGNDGLVTGKPSVNGYSPLGHRGLFERFCFGTQGQVCPEAGPNALQKEPITQQPLLDLMKVGNIVAERGPLLDRFQKVVQAPWAIVQEKRTAVLFARPLPNAVLPGSLSWPTAGIVVSEQSLATATRETLSISQRDKGATPLVFARTNWPGYHATWNGHDLPLRSLGGFLVSVELPDDGSNGELILFFRPPFFEVALGLSIASLLAMIAMILGWCRVVGVSRDNA